MNNTYHVVGMPTLQIVEKNMHSPIVNIINNMCEMLSKLPGEVIYYGVPGSTVKCDKFVPIVTLEEYNVYIETKTENEVSLHSTFNVKGEYYLKSKKILKEALEKKVTSTTHDFILLTHTAMSDSLDELNKSGHIIIEYAVNCPYRYANYAVYPTQHQQTAVRTLTDGFTYNNIKFYDFVVPHAVNPDDCKYLENPTNDYLLWMGRIQYSKGFHMLEDFAKFTNLKIKIAGSVGYLVEPNLKKTLERAGFEFLGKVVGEEKKKLLANAAALLTPSNVFETYNIASIEAMMSGTPVICTDAAGFSENIIHGKTGFRIHTLEDIKTALHLLPTLDRKYIRDYAYANFSTDMTIFKYEDIFRRIQDIHMGNGWYNSSLGSNLFTIGKKEIDEKALIVVAHSDDELIEHGLFMKKSLHRKIKVVVVTKDSIIPEIRKNETRSFCKSVGVNDVMFLDHTDAGIDIVKLEQQLKNIIADYKPNMVLTHSEEKNFPHIDHLKVSRLIFNLVDNKIIRTINKDYGIHDEDLEWKIKMFNKYFESQTTNVILDRVYKKMKMELNFI